MEERCKKCKSKAEYICVCSEKHLCDKCLLNHVSTSDNLSHRPVSLAHPLLTLLLESEGMQAQTSSNSIKDQILKLSSFKEKSISMIEKKIKTLMDQSEKNSIRRSINKTNDTNTLLKISSPISYNESPVLDSRSHYSKSPVPELRNRSNKTPMLSSRSNYNKSPGLCREDLSPEPSRFSSIEKSISQSPQGHYKIILTGDSRVGKTTLLKTFKKYLNTDDSNCIEKVKGSVRVDGNVFHIDLWDLSGKDRFFALHKICLYKAAAAVILFDLSNDVTLKSVENRFKQFAEEADIMSVVAIVGNKLDYVIKYPKKRHISYEKGFEMAASKGMMYDEISAFNEQHVSELFKRISKEIFKRKLSVSE